MQHNVARFALVIGGIDYAPTLIGEKPEGNGKKTKRLISLQLTEKLEDGADELAITLSNHDGQLAPIKRGVLVSLSLGWASGPEVTVGLVNKGTFRIDQIEKSGPPDQVRITARSADLTGAMRRRKDKGWTGKTIGAVVKEIAAVNRLTARVHQDLAGIAMPSAEQAAKSDMAFVRDLGRRYDAVATVKNGSLLFMPIGADTNAGNERLSAISLSRRNNARFTFTIADREENDGAEATWHDRGDARKRTVKAGEAKNPKRIKRSFASEKEAEAAVKAEASRASRGQHTLTYDMPLGDAAIEPNRKAKVAGFDSEIDGIRWLIKQVTHSISGGGGFVTTLEMESLGGGPSLPGS